MVQLTQERLKELLHYDSGTGMFIWREDRGRLAKKGGKAGCPHKKGWISLFVEGKAYKAHRLAWLYVYGEWPQDQIDHINRDNSDNRIINLRDVSHSINQRNKRIYKTNKRGITGIYKIDYGYRVEVNSCYLGFFKDFFEACCARKSAEAEHGYL